LRLDWPLSEEFRLIDFPKVTWIFQFPALSSCETGI
jgi:hypothetical protein